MMSVSKFQVLFGFALFAVIGSGSFVASTVQAQSTASCNWFTGVYRDQGRGVIVHIGDNRLVVYNGNPVPLSGKCTSADRIEATFGNGTTLTGRKSQSDIAWSNGTVWRRQSSNVTYPLNGF
jgi:hypothetical protein